MINANNHDVEPKFSQKDKKFIEAAFEDHGGNVKFTFFEMNDDGSRTKIRVEALEENECFDRDEFTDILKLCGWPARSVRVYATNPEAVSEKNYIASKRFYSVGTEPSSVATPEVITASASDKLVSKWNTPEGAEAIVSIVDRILHSIGPLIVETIRESETAKYEAKLHYERKSQEIKTQHEQQALQQRRGY